MEPCECVICNKTVDGVDASVSTIGEKGSSSINRASNARGDRIYAVPGQKVHIHCRRAYNNPQQISKDTRKQETTPTTSSTDIPTLRSTEGRFSFSSDCLFCGTPAQFGRKRKVPDVVQVKKIEFKDTLIATCSERNDAWADSPCA